MNAIEARKMSDEAAKDYKYKEIDEIYHQITEKAKRGEYSLTTDTLYDRTIKILEREGYLLRKLNGRTYISW